MNFRVDDSRILLTLAKGDYINRTFESFAEVKGIGCAWINGIGALENPEIGYFSIENKSYNRKHLIGEFELTSLIGNISIKEGKPYVHSHVTFSDTNYKVFGGHLFDARITAAGEFLMQLGNDDINRKINQDIGLSLWCLEKNLE